VSPVDPIDHVPRVTPSPQARPVERRRSSDDDRPPPRERDDPGARDDADEDDGGEFPHVDVRV
jgi:hypothetical protein